MPSSPPAVAVFIPARYGSVRFPGKPLAEIAGKPLIQHVYEAVKGIRHVKDIKVVTDDSRILQTVEAFGGRACLVDSPCRTGTDRIAKAAAETECDVAVNLQGDEIPLHPGLLSDLIEAFMHSDAQMGTLKRPLKSYEEVNQPSVVKVVTNQAGEALYFSRSPIPYLRDGNSLRSIANFYTHLGVYIFRRDTLIRFAELPTGILEEAEKLEQLRALEHGIPIKVWETQHPSLRIDHVEDLKEASEILSNLEGSKFQVSSFRT